MSVVTEEKDVGGLQVQVQLWLIKGTRVIRGWCCLHNSLEQVIDLGGLLCTKMKGCSEFYGQ